MSKSAYRQIKWLRDTGGASGAGGGASSGPPDQVLATVPIPPAMDPQVVEVQVHKPGGMARSLAAGAGILAGAGGLSDFATPEQFLAWAATSAGSAALLFGTIQMVEKYVFVPRKKTFTGTAKFYTALVLAFAYPIGAYYGLTLFGSLPWSQTGLLASLFVALSIAKTIHWEGSPANVDVVKIEGGQ